MTIAAAPSPELFFQTVFSCQRTVIVATR